jgi:hypothetical protein
LSSEELALAELLIFIFITSPFSGVPTKSVPILGSSSGRTPTVARVIVVIHRFVRMSHVAWKLRGKHVNLLGIATAVQITYFGSAYLKAPSVS